MIGRKTKAVVTAVLCAALITPLPAKAKENPVHILLIGQDRQQSGASARSDTILLCSYLPDSRELVMTSFLRDLYVPIPGHGSNRINAAYALGGRKLLRSTLAENFDLSIDGCVEVDFEQFEGIIDTVGGVLLELRPDEAAHINRDCPGSELTGGEQLLTGKQALCYARIRRLDPDGDFSRTRRQQAVLLALLRRWRHADTMTLLSAVRQLLPLVSTDLSPGQILHWTVSAAPSMGSLRFRSLQIPAPGTCRDETIRGMAVLRADLQANRALLEEALQMD